MSISHKFQAAAIAVLAVSVLSHCGRTDLATDLEKGRLAGKPKPTPTPTATPNPYAGPDTGRRMDVMSDGRIVVAGWGNDRKYGAVSRYTATGVLDATFNASGPIPGHLKYRYLDKLTQTEDTKVLADGKVLVVGGMSSGYNYCLVSRFNANGTLDTTFNASGAVPGHATLQPGTGKNCQGSSLVVQPDGKILFTGYGSFGTVGRFNANGTIDTTFHGTGWNSNTSFAHYQGALMADGSYIAGGDTGSTAIGLAKYTSNGNLDTTWRGGGKFFQPLQGYNQYFGGITLDSSGKILVAGACDFKYCVARFLANGNLDTTFNGTGFLVTPANGWPWSIFTQPDGKIVMTGNGDADGNSEIGVVLVRVNANGTIDTTFHGTGYAYVTFGDNYNEIGYGGALTQSGDYAVTGLRNSQNTQFGFGIFPSF
jgi:uncharacterized delta-60 repeat protein